MIDGWKYYNHALIPSGAPDNTPDISLVKKNVLEKLGGILS